MNLTNNGTVIDQGGPVGSLREVLIGAWQLVACVETDNLRRDDREKLVGRLQEARES